MSLSTHAQAGSPAPSGFPVPPACWDRSLWNNLRSQVATNPIQSPDYLWHVWWSAILGFISGRKIKRVFEPGDPSKSPTFPSMYLPPGTLWIWRRAEKVRLPWRTVQQSRIENSRCGATEISANPEGAITLRAASSGVGEKGSLVSYSNGGASRRLYLLTVGGATTGWRNSPRLVLAHEKEPWTMK